MSMVIKRAGSQHKRVNGQNREISDVPRRALVAHLDLRDATHVGHSTGGGEATRYVARHGRARRADLLPERTR
jgi:hypothetical protein